MDDPHREMKTRASGMARNAIPAEDVTWVFRVRDERVKLGDHCAIVSRGTADKQETEEGAQYTTIDELVENN